jgi:cytochrome c-type biogenesis protein CcmH/NrfF
MFSTSIKASRHPSKPSIEAVQKERTTHDLYCLYPLSVIVLTTMIMRRRRRKRSRRRRRRRRRRSSTTTTVAAAA